MNEPQFEAVPGNDGEFVLRLSGRLENATVPPLWAQMSAWLKHASPRKLIVDAAGVTYCDVSGVALLVNLLRKAVCDGPATEVRGLPERFQQMLDLFEPAEFSECAGPTVSHRSLPEHIGRVTVHLWEDLRTHVNFIGELGLALVRAMVRPGSVRWRDLWLAAERAGADALPIVALINFLVGMVLAFQSAMGMRAYGAEVFVADLVTIATLRELGPLMTAIILAGRTGASFAAELGTMKVNEEVNALTVMGLEPVRFLVVPRLLGLVLMMPMLTLFADLMGILGGGAVWMTLDYPLSTYVRKVIEAADLSDLAGGLIKAVLFGITIAGIGCLRGLQTDKGPSAVGISTTSAVVTGILLIVVIDAVMGTVFYFIGF